VFVPRERFKVIINKLRNAFIRVSIAQYERATRIFLFVNFRKNIERASSRIGIGSEVFVGIFINQFFIKQASGEFFNSVLYSVCKVFSLFS